MSLTDTLFPVLIVVILLLSAWSLYEQYRFDRADGKMKRGLMVRAESLSWEARDFLEALPPGRLDETGGFIYKEGRELLIGEERSFWSGFSRRNSFRYVGYIDLSAPESRLEFRAPWSTLGSTLISLLMLLVMFYFFTNFFEGSGDFGGALFGGGIVAFILVVTAVSMWVGHFRERKRLSKILDRAVAQRS